MALKDIQKDMVDKQSKAGRILGTLLALSIIGASIYWLVTLIDSITLYENQGHKAPFTHISLKVDY